jgi:hypothetical protein
MSKKPIEVPKIGFNEALQRISKFDKDTLPDSLKKDTHSQSEVAGKINAKNDKTPNHK